MMDLGPHASFIWWSYAVVAGVVAALIAWLVSDGRRQQRLLAQLEARGITRRSKQAGAKPGAADNADGRVS